ncbi:MAG: carboxypeptidase-like regulatory domain-containing protein [Gemmatimonas sp.]
MSHRDDADTFPPDSDDTMMNTFNSAPYKAEWLSGGHVVEDSVYAWLDGALDATDSAALEVHVRACRECAAAVAEARGFIAASMRIMNAADLSPRNTQRNVAPGEDVSRAAQRIIALADKDVATPARTAASLSTDRIANARKNASSGTGRSRRWYEHTFVRVAAAALLMVAGSYAVTRESRTTNADGVTRVSTMPVAPGTDSVSPESLGTSKPSVVAAVDRVDATDQSRQRMNARTNPSANTKRVGDGTPSLRGRVAAIPPAAAKERSVQTLPGVNIEATAEAQSVRRSTFATSVVIAEPLDTFTRRTITGNVRDRVTSAPLATANVFVPGTPLSATTDALGNFTLRNVPASARDLEVKRLGYSASQVSIASIRGAVGSVNVTLQDRPLLLDQVTVAGTADTQAPTKSTVATTTAPRSGDVNESVPKPIASTPTSVRSAACFVAVSEGSETFVPLVRGVRARLQKPGQYEATVTGWPKARDQKRVTLVLNAEGTLRGSIRSGDRRLELDLVPRGDDWFSTIQEFRGGSVRTENIRFTGDTLAAKCR